MHENDAVYDYIAYCDGSCDNADTKCGGSAYIIIQGDYIIKEAHKGFQNTTNNRMEMLAIISAVYSVPEGSSIMVYSDSQYAINVFTGKWRANTNKDLLMKYLHISYTRNVSFTWVKGHSGDKYNEMVDSLAFGSCEDMVFKTGRKPGKYFYVNHEGFMQKSLVNNVNCSLE